MIETAGRFHAIDTDHVVAGANEIFDDDLQEKQSEINAENESFKEAQAELNGAQSDFNSEVRKALGSGGTVDERIVNAVNTEKTRAEAAEGALDGRVDTLEEAVGTGGSVDERIAEEGAKHYLKEETYNKSELNNMITTPNQEYVPVTATAQTTAVTDVLPATGDADTTYRVGNWDGTQYNDSVFSEYAWNGSSYIKLSTKSQVGEVYDISANHADTKYADLAAALGTNGANIPQSLRKGGMSVKFVQSSDNKYVQARLMHPLDNSSTAAADFANTANWQTVDTEPAAGSENLVKSLGIYDGEHDIKSIIGSQGYNITLTENDYSGIAYNGETFFDASGSSSFHSWIIEVYEGQEIIFNTNIIPTHARTLSSYPQIGKAPTTKRIISEVIEDRKITIQKGERYIFWGNFRTYQGGLNVIASKSALIEQIDKLKHLKNKKIVCFGDSITERQDGTGKRYSDYMEELSEATIINVGIGGSQFKQRRPLTLTPSDEMDAFAALDIVSLVDAVCSQNFTYQQAAATYLDARPGEAGQKQAILDRLEAIDWSTIDAITVFAGTNDWAGSPDSNRIGQTGSTDRSYTLGAINEIIRMMSTTYPNIKIYWFTPTIRYLARPDSILTNFDSTKWCDNAEGVQHYTLKEFVNLVINEVSLSHIPICNLYNMGWNQYNMINYFPAADGTHPNTVNGFTFIAKKMLGFIYSENTI